MIKLTIPNRIINVKYSIGSYLIGVSVLTSNGLLDTLILVLINSKFSTELLYDVPYKYNPDRCVHIHSNSLSLQHSIHTYSVRHFI